MGDSLLDNVDDIQTLQLKSHFSIKLFAIMQAEIQK
jgi:hypothetical protein